MSSSARYDGVLVTTVSATNACGRNLGTQTTRIPSTIWIQAPLRNVPASPGLPAPVGADDNPLNLKLHQSTTAAGIAPGAISLGSALLFNSTSPSVILRYWGLGFDGTSLTGTLVEDHREEAAAFNLLAISDELVPCRPELGIIPNVVPLREGTRLSGTVTATEVRLRIEGNVLRGDRAFVAEIVAARVS